ncbi:hypothetical protein Holit_02365 [Hollandina sp. SP2]
MPLRWDAFAKTQGRVMPPCKAQAGYKSKVSPCSEDQVFQARADQDGLGPFSLVVISRYAGTVIHAAADKIYIPVLSVRD